MKSTVVRVPGSLVLSPDLSPSAKLVWMVCRLCGVSGPAGLAALQSSAGLDRRTVRTALSQLMAAGWCSAAPGERFVALEPPLDQTKAVTIPVDLVADRRVGARAKVLYGELQLLPEYCEGSGRFRHTTLRDLTGANVKSIRHAVAELAATGWLQATQRNQLTPVEFRLADPVVAMKEAEVFSARARLEEDGFTGEGIMHEFLSLLVSSREYHKNARPGFLKNPLTDELMEFDRYYPLAAVAFEYNGPQHQGPTTMFPSQLEACRQQARDLMKQAICVNRGITLLVIQARDLSLEGLQQKIGSLLPQRDLAGHEPLAAYLEAVGRRYRMAARASC